MKQSASFWGGEFSEFAVALVLQPSASTAESVAQSQVARIAAPLQLGLGQPPKWQGHLLPDSMAWKFPSAGMANLRFFCSWPKKNFFSRGIPLKANLIWAALFSVIAMSGCGGGNDDSETSAAPATNEAPATPIAPVTQTAETFAATSAANCPVGVRTFSVTDSILAGASTSIQHETTTLSFVTPRTAFTVKLCVVQNAPSTEFPATPAALIPVLTGSPQYAVLADGQFDQLSNKQLTANFLFPANAPEQYLNKKLVAYTQDGSGAWVKTVLATTQRPGKSPTPSDMVNIEMVALITSPGFYTVE